MFPSQKPGSKFSSVVVFLGPLKYLLEGWHFSKELGRAVLCHCRILIGQVFAVFISQASFMSETGMKLAYEPLTVYIETSFGLDSEMRGNEEENQ